MSARRHGSRHDEAHRRAGSSSGPDRRPSGALAPQTTFGESLTARDPPDWRATHARRGPARPVAGIPGTRRPRTHTTTPGQDGEHGGDHKWPVEAFGDSVAAFVHACLVQRRPDISGLRSLGLPLVSRGGPVTAYDRPVLGAERGERVASVSTRSDRVSVLQRCHSASPDGSGRASNCVCRVRACCDWSLASAVEVGNLGAADRCAVTR